MLRDILILTIPFVLIFLMPKGVWARGYPRPWYRTFLGALIVTTIYAIIAIYIRFHVL